MSNHEYYETLCSLAALGQISAEEVAELEEHLAHCASCRVGYADFEKILSTMLVTKGVEHKLPNRFLNLFSRRNTYKERFAAAARQRGIQFSEEACHSEIRLQRLVFAWLGQNYKFALVTLVLLAGIGVFGYRLQERRIESAALAREKVRLSNENAALRQQISALAEAKSSVEAAFIRTRDAYSSALMRAGDLGKQLKTLSMEIESLRAMLSVAKNREEGLQQQLQEAERVLAQVTNQFQQLRVSQHADAATISAQQAQINELSETLRGYVENLDRAQRLLAADRDIRDLMAARNLHIVDVFDIDGKGKTKRPFGRVFYTEGKSLVFYAFDLENEEFSKAKHSFQAWGYREPAIRSARNLGIFYADDEKQNRWVLKFEDPDILEEIDAVFVTTEAPGGGLRPTGKKLLYAYLRNKPNHP